jgi:hypothetical protein
MSIHSGEPWPIGNPDALPDMTVYGLGITIKSGEMNPYLALRVN